jgi:hypothetical protein
MIIFTSSLTKWPGSFSLPGYDDFDGEMWDAYREIMDSGMADDTINRRFCYAGLALIDKFGTWEMETIALSEMQTWAKDKKAEKDRSSGQGFL